MEQRIFIANQFELYPNINGSQIRKNYMLAYPKQADMFGKKV